MSARETSPIHHWLLERLNNELAEDYARIRADHAGRRQNAQRTGHIAEATWEVLADWLPPQYEFGSRRYLVYELEVDGKSRSDEVDLVLFHPAYPRHLRRRSKKEVLVSGVSAAFSIKLTLTPSGLKEAIDSAALLRRGMIHPRNEPIGDLVSPLIVGVLALSHRGFGKNPQEKIEKLLLDAAADLRPPDMVPGASTSGLPSHPRNELDFVCVANLDCWHRHPRVFRQPADSQTTPDVQYAAPWGSKKKKPQGADRVAVPIAILVNELWKKLAHRDPALRQIADGFQWTGTPGVGQGRGVAQPLGQWVNPETRAKLIESLPAVDGLQLFEVD